MIVVTGGAGFIGSNLVRALNARGKEDILVVDDLTDGEKFRNLSDCRIMDYWDIGELDVFLRSDRDFPLEVEAVFHQGACTDTTNTDGRFMMENNFRYSKQLLHYCLDRLIPCIYASSASVYGVSRRFEEEAGIEAPLNVYGYSKFLFDEYARRQRRGAKSQVVGLRYFNVYGRGEQHKRAMASVVFQFNRQLLIGGEVKLFRGSGGFGDGGQRRDFVHVDDVVAVNLWCLDHPEVTGIFNVGTGRSRSFNEVARILIDWHGRGEIAYIDFPEHLQGNYQSFTEADIRALRQAGYTESFLDLEEGARRYLGWLNQDAA